MTDMAGALADNSNLTPFEGEPTLSVGIEIPGLSGGLRDSMRIDPVEHRAGDRLYVLVEVDVDKFHYDPVRSGGRDGERVGWRRVEILSANTAMFVDPDSVKSMIDEHKRRIQRAKDEASGQGRLGTDDELHADHADGRHADGYAEGCVDCAEEVRATGAEQLADVAPIKSGRARKTAAKKTGPVVE